MAVYTHIDDDHLAALLAQYDIGAALACEGISEGVENTNYKLTTPAGRFILTIFEKRVAEADLPFFMTAMEQLAQRGFPAPRPVAMRDGGYLSEAHGKPAAIVTFLDGAWPRTWDARHCAAVGEAMARMHTALADLEAERPNGLRVDGWEALLRPRLAQAEALRPGLAVLIECDMREEIGRASCRERV